MAMMMKAAARPVRISGVGVSGNRGSGVWVGVSVGGVPLRVLVGLNPNSVGVNVNVGVGCVGVIVGVSVMEGTGVGEPGIAVAVGGRGVGSAGNAQEVSRKVTMANIPIFLIHSSSTL